jgi:putative heme-binding domain-containing protein
LDVIPVVEKLVTDESPQLRRECAIALRHVSSERKVELWLKLAEHAPKGDRWTVEALGLALDADTVNGWEAAIGYVTQHWKEIPNRKEYMKEWMDLFWRARGFDWGITVKLSMIQTLGGYGGLPPDKAGVLRMFRSLDFHDRAKVSEYASHLLKKKMLATLDDSIVPIVVTEVLARLTEPQASEITAVEALKKILDQSVGTPQFVQLVLRFARTDRYPDVLQLSQAKPSEQLGVEAISALLELKQWQLLSNALKGDDTFAAISTAEALGNSSSGAIAGLLLPVIKSADVNIDVRRAAVKAASKVNNGAAELVKLVDEKTLDPELEQTVAAALHSAPSREARAQAQRLFPLPPSKDNMPTPPINELTKLVGNTPNGRMVFFSTGTCHKCHVVDGMGREIGPNLTEIGSKLSREAMFESVLYPSAGISHNFELWTIVLNSGTTVNGMLTSNTDEEVSIKGDDALVRTFKKSDVEELVQQKISMMPADLQKTMTTQELADVVEYMQSLKKK